MFTPIDVPRNERKNITLFDTHDIQIKRDNNNDVELVIHPSKIANLTVRFAKNPYRCYIHTKMGKQLIDLGDESDWGNIDTCVHTCPQFGNDVDGWQRIFKVTDLNNNVIPLENFCQDVEDFIIYYEC